MAKINGTGKDDVLKGGASADLIYGGAGNDRLSGGSGADQLYGNSGDDILYGDSGDDRLRGGDGSDRLMGGTGADRLWGDAGDDFLFGESGADILSGGDGNDILGGGTGTDDLRGGAGNDTYFNQTGNDTMYDTAGDDIFHIQGNRARPEITDKTGSDHYIVENPASRGWIFDLGGANDEIEFHKYVGSSESTLAKLSELDFVRDGSDLLVRVDGHKEYTTLSYFFEGSKYRIEDLVVGTGKSVDGTKEYDLRDLSKLELEKWTSGDDLW